MSNKYFKPIEYKEKSKRLAYKGKRLQVEEIKYLNGEQVIYREHVKAGEGVAILPITKKNEVIMVQEPRTPINKIILALPAGMIEPNELPEDAAVRELEEETGYLAGNIKLLREYYPSVGYSNEKIKIYLATDLKKTQQHLDETEDINVIKLPLEEVIEMLDKNEIITASTTMWIRQASMKWKHPAQPTTNAMICKADMCRLQQRMASTSSMARKYVNDSLKRT